MTPAGLWLLHRARRNRPGTAWRLEKAGKP